MQPKGRFLERHDRYLHELDLAYQTAETTALLPFFHPAYHGYFGTRQTDQAIYYDREGALEGIVQTGTSLSDTASRCLSRHVRMPTEQDAVVFYEKSMSHAKGVVHAFMIEVWREIDGNWLLPRETVELA